MQVDRLELSECEKIVMKCIWDEGEPVTCPQVMDQLKGKYGLDYKDTTVYSFLKNLKNKGFVTSERKGVTYYTAIQKEEDYRAEVLRRTEQFWFDGSSARMVSALIQARNLDSEKREEIKRMIDEMED